MLCRHSISRRAGTASASVGPVATQQGSGFCTRSGAGKLRHLGVKEFWVQERVQARKLVSQKVGTDDSVVVGTTYSDDGMKFTHLLGLGGVTMKRGVELVTLSVATVALQGCASIVHVGGTVTGSTAAVTVSLSAEIVITVPTGVLACG